MITAKLKTGKVISLLDAWEHEQLKQLQAAETFYCQACNEQVMMKIGPHRKWHFAHYKEAACGSAEAESEYHLKGKQRLYEWFSEQQIAVELESYFPAIKQRPDLYITSPYETPIEYQCSTIRDELFLKRTTGYQKIKKKPLWILGGNRLKRVAKQTFQLNRMDWLALNEIGNSPHESFLLYFCPETDRFALLTNIIPYSSTKVIGHLEFIQRKNLNYKKLLEIIPHVEIFTNEEDWPQIKINWRLYPYRRQTPAFRYVNRMLQTLNRDIPLFPSEAGLSSKYLFWIETPPHLWQSWLLIHCIYPLPVNETIQFHDVYVQFKRLVEKHVFSIRTLPLIKKSHYSFAIMDYLLHLCDARVLKRVGKSTFKKLKQIKLPTTLDEAMKMDRELQALEFRKVKSDPLRNLFN